MQAGGLSAGRLLTLMAGWRSSSATRSLDQHAEANKANCAVCEEVWPPTRLPDSQRQAETETEKLKDRETLRDRDTRDRKSQRQAETETETGRVERRVT